MQKTALTIFGALLISGMSVQMAAASERHHHMTRASKAVIIRTFEQRTIR